MTLEGTYQSDPYPCPFPAAFADPSNVFTPCYFLPETYARTKAFNSPPHTDSQPKFVLGSLAEKDVIKIRLDFPDASGSVRTFKLKLLNADGTSLAIQPLPFNRDINISVDFYETFWTVPADGNYILEITSTDPADGDLLFWYYITVWNANSGTVMLKEVDVLRSLSTICHLVSVADGRETTIKNTHSGG